MLLWMGPRGTLSICSTTKSGPCVFFVNLHFHGQLEQQHSQPQGNFAGQVLNLDMGLESVMGSVYKTLGYFLIQPIIVMQERVGDHIIFSFEPLAVLPDACGHVVHYVHPCCLQAD